MESPECYLRFLPIRLVRKFRVKETDRKYCFLSQVTELEDMIMKAEEIERKYGHYFDLTIVNDDLQDAYDRLYTAAYLVAKEPQWIPVNWLA